MKRTIAYIAFIALCQTLAFGQKKYKMVVETTDGNSVTFPTENIKRIYFLESNISYKTCPDNNHPHLIDLGLPSGTKWACCNVGASQPEDYGKYYAWGETQQKDKYDWTTYIHCDGSPNTCHDLGSDIAGTQYDAATANWGAPWRMPSNDQCIELINNCTSVWATENGVNGRKFTGSNGGTIFIPVAGFWRDGQLYDAGSYGDYWTSTPLNSSNTAAWGFYFSLDNVSTWGNGNRFNGLSVRPVR